MTSPHLQVALPPWVDGPVDWNRRDTGSPVPVGVNLAVPSHNCVLQSHSLGAEGMPPHERVSSCEPCAMCLGATFWSGVARLVTGATKADAEAVGYDQGPIFAESYAYLERRGIEFVREVRREEARTVFADYVAAGGVIY